jgi:hypothetical protein
LFQEIIRATGHLEMVFLVNRYPVSNNIALDTFDDLLADEYFGDLSRYRSDGRVRVQVEGQVFRSFEYNYLSPAARDMLEQSSLVFIKGANFFETLQPTGTIRYHGFTVYGYTSAMLSGCPEGSGVFARIPAGQAGYEYSGPANVRTLAEIARQPVN